MATNTTDQLSNSRASRRKFLCLVAALKAKGIKSLEQFLAAPDMPRDAPLDQLLLAIEEAKRAQTPRSENALKRIIDADGSFTPSRPKEEEWLEFEQLRLGPMTRSTLNGYDTMLIWSPVELWLRFHKCTGNKQACHFISLLTNESYYVAIDGSDWSANWKMMEADNSEHLPIQRSPNSIMSSSLPGILLSKPLIPLTPLVHSLLMT